MNTHHHNIHCLADVHAVLATQGLAVDTVYQDVIFSGFRYGTHHDNLGIHYYFNNGKANVACYTPALGVVQVFNPPRRDDMVGEKRYTRRPAAQNLSA